MTPPFRRGPQRTTSYSGERVYRWNDEVFPSVTTILNALSKPALAGWAARETAKFAVENIDEVAGLARKDPGAAIQLCKSAPWRGRDAAANVGSAVHDLAESYSMGRPPPEVPEELAGYVASYRQFVEDWRPKYLAVEVTVFSRLDTGYAGSLDFIAEIAGRTVLGDIKTTASGVYPETALQLAAYRHADFIGLRDGTEMPMPETRPTALVLHLRPEGYQLLPVPADEEVFGVFRALMKVWEWRKAGSPIGQPIERRPAAPSGVLGRQVVEG